jgi:hypothetical protein
VVTSLLGDFLENWKADAARTQLSRSRGDSDGFFVRTLTRPGLVPDRSAYVALVSSHAAMLAAASPQKMP